ncbi:hypothetical protein C806_01826 [Lachnospiraceae bacterium 3-1]|nr:hypothetical protein C806_01826 [Lachnospiraceae bacterium 3-1]
MDIVIIAQYLGDLEHLETTNGRFIYLAKMLSEQNNVEIITTTFPHSLKRQAKSIPDYFEGCKVTALYEPGYPKNVCLKRFISHHSLAKNVERYLNCRKKPDIIYAAVPSLSVASVAAKFCRKNNIRFIVDVQDLWPEAFKMVFHIPIISNLIFFPMQRQADFIYSSADGIVAVSQTYANRALRVNKKCKEAKIVYLGTDKEVFDKYASRTGRQQEKEDEIKVAYVGSLSDSYDISSIIEAIKIAKSKKRLKFIVMGQGGRKVFFERQAQLAGINYIFTGNLPYPQMVEQLNECDIAVNPIRKGSAGSIINKVGDYAMAGLPVINTQESQEYRKLLEKYRAGINCLCEDIDDIAKALQLLADDEELRIKMGKNSRKLGKDRFDRNSNYQKIVESIVANKGGGNTFSVHRNVRP